MHETPASALVDGGNNVGNVAVYRGTEIATVKASQSGIAAVGVYNSYFSGAQRLLPRTHRQCRTPRPAYRQRRAAHRAARRNPPRSWHQPDCLRLSIGRWAGHLNDLTVNAAYSAPSSRSASPIKPGEISIWLARSVAVEFSPYRLLLPAETRRVLLQQFALRPHEASRVVLSHLLLQRIVGADSDKLGLTACNCIPRSIPRCCAAAGRPARHIKMASVETGDKVFIGGPLVLGAILAPSESG